MPRRQWGPQPKTSRTRATTRRIPTPSVYQHVSRHHAPITHATVAPSRFNLIVPTLHEPATVGGVTPRGASEHQRTPLSPHSADPRNSRTSHHAPRITHQLPAASLSLTPRTTRTTTTSRFPREIP